MADELLGDDFYLFHDTNTPIVYATPTWVKQTSFGDLGFDTGNEQVEIPKRIAFKTYKKGRGDWALSFTMNYDRGNAFHDAVIAAINDGTALHLAVADNDVIANGSYWHAKWFLSGPLDASLDTVATIEVEGKVHHDTGTADADLPAFVAGST